LAPHAFISGLSGTALSEDEIAFLRDANPWGVILFARNVENLQQVKRLVAAAREALGREDAPVLIDQEGGRVQRIQPPHVPRTYPAGSVYARAYRRNALTGVEMAFLGAKLIGLDLFDLGISVDCLPVLDIPIEGGTLAIGDRTLGDNVDAVATLGGAQIDGLLSSGVLPVIKHMPGHGRATVDSHLDLPQVDATMAELEAQDFTPFRLLAKRAPLGMTAHVVFLDVDDGAPATLSKAVIGNIIRERIGFDGALMTDDISMGALSGEPRERAEKAIAAGCDLVVHCNGKLDEMREIAAGVPELAGDALRRTEAALAFRRAPDDMERPALEKRFQYLLDQAIA
jgi:beta-N-acetylhexosaminidase